MSLSQYIEPKRLALTKIFSGVIHGHLPSGKNNYKLGESLGKKIIFKDKSLKDYEDHFMIQASVLVKKICLKIPITDDFLALDAKVYFRDFRRDVDTILFCDLLQKSGIIKNDRMIRFKIIDGRHVDKKNPRIEFTLYRIDN